MSIVIYTKNAKQSNIWLDTLKNELPNHKIEVYPDVSDFDEVELLICWKPYHGLIEKFSNLKAIQSLGAGVDHIFDSNIIHPFIQVSKLVNHQLTQDMWEHILGIVLYDMKNFSFYEQQMLKNNWKPRWYKNIKDITLGIFGLGTIGNFVARQFSQLGFDVIGWSKSAKNIKNVTTYTGQKGIDTVCKNSDYLINILPLTTETKGILNKNLFSKMKSSSYLINVGRGAHVVDDDLLDALNSGVLRGAALDVFHEEPLRDVHGFWSHTGVFITPHVASLTNVKSVYPQIIENIRRLNSGLPLLNRIDIEKGY